MTCSPPTFASAPPQGRRPRRLRIELTRPAPDAAAYRLERRRYIEVSRAMPGETLRLAEPFTIEADLAALATATRPWPDPRATRQGIRHRVIGAHRRIGAVVALA